MSQLLGNISWSFVLKSWKAICFRRSFDLQSCPFFAAKRRRRRKLRIGNVLGAQMTFVTESKPKKNTTPTPNRRIRRNSHESIQKFIANYQMTSFHLVPCSSCSCSEPTCQVRLPHMTRSTFFTAKMAVITVGDSQDTLDSACESNAWCQSNEINETTWNKWTWDGIRMG